MKSKEDENDSGADQQDGEQSSGDENDERGSGDEESEPERFERSDNLRRRSEWFQKRTGGR